MKAMDARTGPAANGAEAVAGAAKPQSLYMLILFTVMYALMVIDRNIVNVTLESIKHDLKLSDTTVALIAGLGFSAFQAVFGLPAARWADRGDRKIIVVLALSLWSVMTILCGFAQSVVHLTLARFGVGVGEAVAPVQHALLSDAYPKDRRAAVLSIFTVGSPLAVLLGYPVIGWLDQHYGWRVAFMVAGAPGLLLAVVVLLTLKDPRKNSKADQESMPSVGAVARTLWARRSYVLCVSGYIVSQFGIIGFTTWSPTFLKRVYHFSSATMGGSLGLSTGLLGILGGIVGAVVLERSNRHGDRWKAIWPATATLLIMPFMLLATLGSSPAMAVFAFGAVAFLGAFKYGPQLALTANVVGSRMRAVASSMQGFTAAIIAIGLGPVYIGALNDALQHRFGPEVIRYSMASCAIFVLAGGWLILRGSRFIVADMAKAAEADSRIL
jgi:predicted MFS family arabinose efflux permease